MKSIDDVAKEAAHAQRFSEQIVKAAERVCAVIVDELAKSPAECHTDNVLHSYISALLMIPFQTIFQGSETLRKTGYAATYSIEKYITRYRVETLKKHPSVADCIDDVISSKEYCLKNGKVEQVNDFMKEKSP